jgi:adenosine deaminase
MMFEMAARNGVSLRHGSVGELREAYDFADLRSFLDLYYEGTQVPLVEQHFYELTWAYLKKSSSQGVRHAEIFFDPQAHTDRGVDLGTVITGLCNAIEEGQRRLGMSSHLIMCFLRHLGSEEAMETLRRALPYKQWIVGVGLDSSEVGHPPEDFEAVFEESGRHGFRKVAHALDDLGAARIDHGVRCVEEHPLRRMLGEGMCVTVNSDDPAYLGGYVADNFSAVRNGLGFSREEFRAVAETSFKASFLDEGKMNRLLGELGSYFEMYALTRSLLLH